MELEILNRLIEITNHIESEWSKAPLQTLYNVLVLINKLKFDIEDRLPHPNVVKVKCGNTEEIKEYYKKCLHESHAVYISQTNEHADEIDNIRADILREVEKAMYHQCFERDNDENLQKWDSGNWIRYKLFENVMKQLKEKI